MKKRLLQKKAINNRNGAAINKKRLRIKKPQQN